jgi:hypothetical protein
VIVKFASPNTLSLLVLAHDAPTLVFNVQFELPSLIWISLLPSGMHGSHLEASFQLPVWWSQLCEVAARALLPTRLTNKTATLNFFIFFSPSKEFVTKLPLGILIYWAPRQTSNTLDFLISLRFRHYGIRKRDRQDNFRNLAKRSALFFVLWIGRVLLTVPVNFLDWRSFLDFNIVYILTILRECRFIRLRRI